MERKLKENWFADLKVGDQVRIIPAKSDTYYPYGFISEMQDQAGKICNIREIIRNRISSTPKNGDKSLYYLKELSFCWRSLMFEPVDDKFYEGFSIPEFKIVL